MKVRDYSEGDWVAVRDIYDLAKPDELRSIVAAESILPLDSDPEMKILFQESQILVMEDGNRIVGQRALCVH